MTNSSYVLGHSDPELARLKMQARLLEPITRQFLREAGITAGMRVLDVGSGAGDVAVLAAVSRAAGRRAGDCVAEFVVLTE
jgi:ubiquinone/menaquinone biosynthesis C-methylase UbiE